MTFTQDITTFVRVTKLRADAVLRRVSLDMHAGVLFRSPVDTGRFRASNRVSINAVDPSVAGEREQHSGPNAGDPATGEELASASAILLSARFGDEVIVSNSLPYAKRLEDGWSSQSPEPGGIYQATFQELTQKFSQLVRDAVRQIDGRVA